MLLKEIIEVCDLSDNPAVNAQAVIELFAGLDVPPVKVTPLSSEKGKTEVVRIFIPGTGGKSAGGAAPTLGILGTLGGLGGRPEIVGLVSDADGALVALAAALRLARMRTRGDALTGDVVIATHICPDAPTKPHKPVPFMDSPVNHFDRIRAEVHPDMDAILSVDATKGNRVINHLGMAVSPTILQGYILKVSPDLLRVMEWVSGDLPATFPATTQDITPYGNGIDHINSIFQPSVIADCPLVGLALTTRSAVPGCASGANQPLALETAARYCIETAKGFGVGEVSFYDKEEFDRLQAMYGDMNRLRTGGWV